MQHVQPFLAGTIKFLPVAMFAGTQLPVENWLPIYTLQLSWRLWLLVENAA